VVGGFGPHTIVRLRDVLPHPDEGDPDPEHRRAAAVLIPLFVDSGELRVVLTKRTDHLRSHSGEVSFPGGGREPSDATLLQTALRETHEEIGLPPEDVEVLGSLEDLPTFGSNYLIRPYVGFIPSSIEFSRDPHEVERVLTPKLELFTDPSLRRIEIRQRDGVEYQVHFFDVDGDNVWGATARMLVRLIELIEN
jgi:8-oxo-dGTP pyrophosphatase MutT (NUDIX family)